MAYLEARTQVELDAALKKARPGQIVAILGDGWFWVDGDSHVEARGSSHVEARGSSHVVAWGSSHVEAWESSHVEARGSSHVEARGSSHVVASKYVSVTLDRNRAGSPQIAGGVLIEIPVIETPDQWCDYYGITVVDGIARVYKALDDDYSTGNARAAGLAYTPGLEEVAAPDWKPTPACGNGLHVSPLPVMAKVYNEAATRFVELGVRLDELVLITEYGIADKGKAPRVLGPIVEVDERRQPLVVAAAA